MRRFYDEQSAFVSDYRKDKEILAAGKDALEAGEVSSSYSLASISKLKPRLLALFLFPRFSLKRQVYRRRGQGVVAQW